MTVSLSVKTKKDSPKSMVISIYLIILVVDQFIANNTAEGSVKVVFPQMLDVEIFDVTPQITE